MKKIILLVIITLSSNAMAENLEIERVKIGEDLTLIRDVQTGCQYFRDAKSFLPRLDKFGEPICGFVDFRGQLEKTSTVFENLINNPRNFGRSKLKYHLETATLLVKEEGLYFTDGTLKKYWGLKFRNENSTRYYIPSNVSICVKPLDVADTSLNNCSGFVINDQGLMGLEYSPDPERNGFFVLRNNQKVTIVWVD